MTVYQLILSAISVTAILALYASTRRPLRPAPIQDEPRAEQTPRERLGHTRAAILRRFGRGVPAEDLAELDTSDWLRLRDRAEMDWSIREAKREGAKVWEREA